MSDENKPLLPRNAMYQRIEAARAEYLDTRDKFDKFNDDELKAFVNATLRCRFVDEVKASIGDCIRRFNMITGRTPDFKLECGGLHANEWFCEFMKTVPGTSGKTWESALMLGAATATHYVINETVAMFPENLQARAKDVLSVRAAPLDWGHKDYRVRASTMRTAARFIMCIDFLHWDQKTKLFYPNMRPRQDGGIDLMWQEFDVNINVAISPEDEINLENMSYTLRITAICDRGFGKSQDNNAMVLRQMFLDTIKTMSSEGFNFEVSDDTELMCQ